MTEPAEGDPRPAGALVVRAARAVVDGRERAVTVHVGDGRITAIDDGATGPADIELAADEVLIPGLVDTHVHINDPGRADWEGFDTATAAAAAGGVTTVIDMPLNSLPPTLSPRALQVKREAAAGRVRVDVGFWGGAVPDNLERLPELLAAGVFGVKCFLQDSGVPEFPPLDAAQLRRAAEVLAGVDGLLLVHAEDPAVLAAAPPPHGRDYPAFLASRPPGAESAAIERVVAASRATGCRVHIVHLSSAAGADVVRRARAEGVRITAETCPHYLTLAAEQVPDGAPQYKCCPPIRGAADQQALWDALADGTIDIVVTDHSPSTPERKQLDVGDLGTAWGGVSSLQFGFAAVWTAARRRGVPLATVLQWMSRGPAALVGLTDRGGIEVGARADLVVLADAQEFRVTAADIRHRHPITPYLGRTLTGVARRVLLAGEPVSTDRVAGSLLRP